MHQVSPAKVAEPAPQQAQRGRRAHAHPQHGAGGRAAELPRHVVGCIDEGEPALEVRQVFGVPCEELPGLLDAAGRHGEGRREHLVRVPRALDHLKEQLP